MEKINLDERILDMKSRLNDILIEISWREIARTYFDKSSSWLYQKLDGLDGGFTKSEAQQLKGSLYDLTDRIRRAADNIPVKE